MCTTHQTIPTATPRWILLGYKRNISYRVQSIFVSDPMNGFSCQEVEFDATRLPLFPICRGSVPMLVLSERRHVSFSGYWIVSQCEVWQCTYMLCMCEQWMVPCTAWNCDELTSARQRGKFILQSNADTRARHDCGDPASSTSCELYFRYVCVCMLTNPGILGRKISFAVLSGSWNTFSLWIKLCEIASTLYRPGILATLSNTKNTNFRTVR